MVWGNNRLVCDSWEEKEEKTEEKVVVEARTVHGGINMKREGNDRSRV